MALWKMHLLVVSNSPHKREKSLSDVGYFAIDKICYLLVFMTNFGQ